MVAVGIAVLFWPDEWLLLGLALFRLIASAMTGIPLLKELKKTMIGLPSLSLTSEIEIGEHTTRTWMGMTFNIDTIISTWPVPSCS